MHSPHALPKFERQFKKFHPKEQELIREEIRGILAHPDIGELKKGPLAGIRAHKFKLHQQLILLAYEKDAKLKRIYLYAVATHENFYKALERYV